MSAKILPGYQLVLESPGWGRTKLFAETLEGLDAEFEAHVERVSAVKESRSRQLLAQVVGKQRNAYKAARARLQGEG